MIEYLIFVYTVAAVTLMAWIDHKTGYIPDHLTYTLIILGLVFSLVNAFFLNFIIAALMFFATLIMYKSGSLGGGDVKMLTGLALVNPFNAFGVVFLAMIVTGLTAVLFYVVRGVVFKRRFDFSNDFLRYGPFISIGFVSVYLAAFFGIGWF